nr:hypothetical protein [Clostridioides sp.]
MKIIIWDKKSAINGKEAEYFLKERIFSESDVFLVLDDYDRVTQIQSVNIIRANYNMPKELTSQEVGEKYIEIIEEQNNQEDEKVSTIDDMQLKQEEQEKIIADLAYELMLLKGAK